MVSLTEPNLIHELEGLTEDVAGLGLIGWGLLNFTGPIKKP